MEARNLRCFSKNERSCPYEEATSQYCQTDLHKKIGLNTKYLKKIGITVALKVLISGKSFHFSILSAIYTPALQYLPHDKRFHFEIGCQLLIIKCATIHFLRLYASVKHSKMLQKLTLTVAVVCIFACLAWSRLLMYNQRS